MFFDSVRQGQVIMLRLKRKQEIGKIWFEIQACGQTLEESFFGQKHTEGYFNPWLDIALARVIKTRQLGCVW
jgi:hypothetical protein